MKKTLVLFVLLFTISTASLFACSRRPTHFVSEAKTKSFGSFEELDAYSDLIVHGVRLEDEETVITSVNGAPASFYTLAKVQITSVEKDTSGNIQVGDVITILENAAYDEANNAYYHLADYNMMVPGCNYLLLLSLKDAGYYVSAGVNYGTISLDDDGRTISNARNASSGAYSHYEPFWQAALEKYGD